MESEATETPADGEALVDDGHVLDIVEEDEVLPYTYSITAYGADLDVAGLVRRLNEDDIVIPTFDPEVTGESGLAGFQRGFVWTAPQINRFVESLLLGLPVPGIFLVREPSNTLLVLDGQQRLRSLQSFYGGVLRGREFRLRGVQDRYENRSYKDLHDDDRRRLDNSIIHATIVKQDEPTEDQSSIYMIFERLNTGGTTLAAHEVRVALYRGDILGLMRELNEDDNWRALYGRPSARLKDQELILRFFALLERSEDYGRPMKGFLNNYMAANERLTDERRNQLSDLFRQVAATIHEAVGPDAFRLGTAINAAILDSMMVGVSRRLQSRPLRDPAALRAAYEGLVTDEGYLALVRGATANEERVRARLGMATSAFADVA